MRIKELRTKKNISQKQLADLVNSSQHNISRYESGAREPNLFIAQAIAKALDCTIEELLEEPKEETE